MKTFINVRYPLIAFLTVSVAVLSTVACVYRQFVWAALAFFILSVFVVLCFVKRRTALALVVLISYLLGILVTGLQIVLMEKREIYIDDKVTVSGYVCDGVVQNKICKIVLDDVEIVLPDGSTERLAGKTQFYLYGEDLSLPQLGTKVTMIAKVQNVYVFRDKVSSVDYCNGVYYRLGSVSQVVYTEHKPTVAMSCLNYMRNRLQQALPIHGNVAYSLITGDRSLIDDQQDAFADAGVLHVFAVSGLHVGFVVAVIAWLLDKLKVRGWAKFCAIVIPLVFYAYVCGFPNSVVRATVMTIVALILQMLWRKTDLLNSASIAGVVLLVINPLNLFNAGFLLSFGAVYGIATVSVALNRAIDSKVKSNVFNKLLKAVSVSVGATAGTIFITARFWGSVATLSVVANLFVVPLVSVIFVFSALCLLPFFFVYLGAIPDLLLGVVKWFANFIASLPFSTLATPRLGVCVLFWLILLFVLGGFVNAKGKGKAVLCVVLALCMVASCVLANVDRADDGSLYMCDSDQGVLIVASDGNGNFLIVSDCSTVDDVGKICDRLDRYKVASLSVAFTNYKQANPNAVSLLLDRYKVDNAYVFDNTGNTVVDQLFAQSDTTVVIVPYNHEIALLDATCIANGVPVALSLTLDGFTFLLVYDVSQVLLSGLASQHDADVVFSDKYLPNLASMFDTSVVLFGKESKKGYKNSLTECGNFTITSKSGTIKVTNGWGSAF